MKILIVKEWHRREGVPVCVISQPELPVIIESTSIKGRAFVHTLVLDRFGSHGPKKRGRATPEGETILLLAYSLISRRRTLLVSFKGVETIKRGNEQLFLLLRGEGIQKEGSQDFV